jgi:hypothetical protein
MSKITFDNSFSPFMGADNSIAARKVLTRIDDILINDSLFNGLSQKKSAFGFLSRLGRIYFIDLNLASLLGLLQHEYYGHCWSYRQFGYEYNSFKISPLPPFGYGSGSASTGKLKQYFDSTGTQIAGYSPPTLSEKILISFSGTMSQQVLADKITQEIFISDSLDYRTCLLYLYNSRSTSGMLLFNTGDMQTYTNQLNNLYGSNNSVYQKLKYLKIRSLVSFINSNDLLSFYNIFWNYLIKAKSKMKTFSFQFKGFRYLPVLRYTLTPFGGQFGISNYFMNKKVNGIVSFNSSDLSYDNFWDVNCEINHKKKNFSFGTFVGIWHQPFMQLESNESNKGRLYGFCMKQEVAWESHKSNFGIFSQIVYKTRGYSPGEYLEKGITLRFGIKLAI